MSTFEIIPEFIPGGKGSLYSWHYCPELITEETECFLIIPPLAEEMNRCRYMCTLFAQAVADKGMGCFSIDPYGTGDSAGDFVDCNWQQTIADMLTALEHLTSLGYKKISLLGIRLGALQALDLVEQFQGINRVILWQPITNGNMALTQFLRIRIAASLSRNEKAETIKDFDAMIEQGKPVEVAGYDLSPSYYHSIKTAKLSAENNYNQTPIAWFTTIASAERKAPKVEINTINKWRENGANIDYTVLVSPPYWQVHERTLAPDLVTATLAYIDGNKADE